MEKVVAELTCQVKDIARQWEEMGAKNLRNTPPPPPPPAPVACLVSCLCDLYAALNLINVALLLSK